MFAINADEHPTLARITARLGVPTHHAFFELQDLEFAGFIENRGGVYTILDWPEEDDDEDLTFAGDDDDLG